MTDPIHPAPISFSAALEKAKEHTKQIGVFWPLGALRVEQEIALREHAVFASKSRSELCIGVDDAPDALFPGAPEISERLARFERRIGRAEALRVWSEGHGQGIARRQKELLEAVVERLSSVEPAQRSILRFFLRFPAGIPLDWPMRGIEAGFRRQLEFALDRGEDLGLLCREKGRAKPPAFLCAAIERQALSDEEREFGLKLLDALVFASFWGTSQTVSEELRVHEDALRRLAEQHSGFLAAWGIAASSPPAVDRFLSFAGDEVNAPSLRRCRKETLLEVSTRVARRRGRPDEALTFLDKLPPGPRKEALHAAIAFNQGRFRFAQELASSAAEHSTEALVQALALLTRALSSSQSAPKSALEDVLKAREIYAAQPDADTEPSSRTLGLLHLELGQWEQAKEALEAETTTNRPPAWCSFEALVVEAEGDFSRAYELLMPLREQKDHLFVAYVESYAARVSFVLADADATRLHLSNAIQAFREGDLSESLSTALALGALHAAFEEDEAGLETFLMEIDALPALSEPRQRIVSRSCLLARSLTQGRVVAGEATPAELCEKWERLSQGLAHPRGVPDSVHVRFFELAMRRRMELLLARLEVREKLLINAERASFRDRQLELSQQPVQLRLLRLLAENAHSIVPRDDLIERLWPGDKSARSSKLNRLRVAVNRLRKGLLGDALQTMRGGYRLNAETLLRVQGPLGM